MLKFKAKFSGATYLKTVTQLKFNIEGQIDMLDYYDLVKKEGWLYFSADEVKFEVEKVMKDRSIGVSENKRSPSQRLRGALFQLFLKEAEEKGGEITEDFEEWYKDKMEKLINAVKNRL